MISTKICIFNIWISVINIINMVLITNTCLMMIALLSSIILLFLLWSKRDGRGGNYPGELYQSIQTEKNILQMCRIILGVAASQISKLLLQTPPCSLWPPSVSDSCPAWSLQEVRMVMLVVGMVMYMMMTMITKSCNEAQNM